MQITCLRDYMHVNGLKEKPPCFYCGLPATEIDHIKPRSKRGLSGKSNIHPACERCNVRKGVKSLDEFRDALRQVDHMATGRAAVLTVRFYGEGARGGSLRRIRKLLTMHVRHGKLLIAPPGEIFAPLDEETKERNRERKERLVQIRWRGRFTFIGSRALRALAKATGCSFPVIERFVMRHPTQSDHKLEAACEKLKLDRAALQALKPKGPAPKN